MRKERFLIDLIRRRVPSACIPAFFRSEIEFAFSVVALQRYLHGALNPVYVGVDPEKPFLFKFLCREVESENPYHKIRAVDLSEHYAVLIDGTVVKLSETTVSVFYKESPHTTDFNTLYQVSYSDLKNLPESFPERVKVLLKEFSESIEKARKKINLLGR